jgi:hypothetical protein
MSTQKKLNQLIVQMENYLECWKQFNQFLTLARSKKFTQEDEEQFLEIESVLVQQLELILASVEVASPSREDVHNLVGSAPSLRYLSEMNEGVVRNVENQWHKVYIGWHAILGQLKVKAQAEESQSGFGALFSRKS